MKNIVTLAQFREHVAAHEATEKPLCAAYATAVEERGEDSAEAEDALIQLGRCQIEDLEWHKANELTRIILPQ